MKNYVVLQILAAIIFLAVLPAEAGQEYHAEASDRSGTKARPDSTLENPEKISSTDGWEKVVSFPGALVNLPFKIVFQSGAWSVERINESQIIPRTIDLLTFENGRAGFVPLYTSRSGAGMKFYAKGFVSEQAKFSASFAAGLRNRKRYQLQMKRLELFDGRIVTHFLGRYRVLSDERFFGLGPNSLEENESNYAHEQSSGAVTLLVPFRGDASFEVGFRYDYNSILTGENREFRSTTDLFNSETLPGMERGTAIAGTNISFLYDSRNNRGNPNKGMTIHASSEVFSEMGGSQFGFWRVSTEVSRYLHLIHDRKLVLRAGVQATDPFSNREIPFYYLTELGSQETIRGFTRGRFRDRDMVTGSIEYRYPIWRAIDALLFIDGGRVTSSLRNEFELDDVQWGFGGGIRVWNREGEILTLQIGKGPEQVRVHFSLFSGD